MLKSIYYVFFLSFFLSTTGCLPPYPYYERSELESICIDKLENPPQVTLDQKNSLIKVLIIPTEFRTFVAGFVDEFVLGLEAKGWIVVDYKTQLLSGDILNELKAIAGQGKSPDIVAYYLPDFIEREDHWEIISKASFTKILISEDLNRKRSTDIAREFATWGDAVFARYPEAFTKVVAPKKVLAFPLYHAASRWYFEANTGLQEKKNIALLSGSTEYGYYPLRQAALKVMHNDPNLIVQRKFAGWDARFDPVAEAKDYAKNIAEHAVAISGAGMGRTPAPYILAKQFEMPAAGTVAITDSFIAPQLEKLGFIENVHYIGATPDTLEDVIKTWLKPEKESELKEIAKAAYDLVKSRHTMQHRVDQFDETAIQVHYLNHK